jgi:hypothetical protein
VTTPKTPNNPEAAPAGEPKVRSSAVLCRRLAEDDALMEVGRKAIEDTLVEWRDSRLSEFTRGNGLVIREKDGSESSIIRMGPEAGVKIALKAIADHLEKTKGGNGGAQDQPEKKWCAWCGVWGDHTSGGCDDLHDALLRRRAI